MTPDAVTIRIVEGGFPHSEILGSKLVRSSPRLIAAYHVLHRLSAPRHPPNALKTLDHSHDRCPPLGSDRLDTQKDHLLPNPSRSPEGALPVREHACRTHPIPARQSHAGRWAIVSPNSRICSLFTISNIRRPLLQQRRIAFDTEHATSGGARRDRTDDLMLAKHALSQLSYGPEWSWVVCNPWWAWDDSNVRPHPYQGCALTT